MPKRVFRRALWANARGVTRFGGARGAFAQPVRLSSRGAGMPLGAGHSAFLGQRARVHRILFDSDSGAPGLRRPPLLGVPPSPRRRLGAGRQVGLAESARGPRHRAQSATTLLVRVVPHVTHARRQSVPDTVYSRSIAILTAIAAGASCV